jgi:hypothetical protein
VRRAGMSPLPLHKAVGRRDHEKNICSALASLLAFPSSPNRPEPSSRPTAMA